MKYYGSVIPHDWDVSFEIIGGLPTVVAFQKINFQCRDKLIFKVSAPMGWVKCHTLMDVKVHRAQRVISNYNRMEPFLIGEI